MKNINGGIIMDYRKIPINEIELDLNNPRIKQWIEIYGDNISSEGIALALSASSGGSTTSSYTALKESIRVNQGLINPIIVNKKEDGHQVVIEGNTRLQIYREFAETDPNGPWKEIIAIVYDNLPENKIHAIRLQTHLVGPRDWDPFSKAKYLNQLSNIDKLPMSMIISFCGGKSTEINRLIDAYTDMMHSYFPQVESEGKDPDPREFSKFAEFQNRSIKEALAVHHFDRNDFAKWVIKGNIDNAMNVRQIPKILANKMAKDVFLKSNITEAVKVLNVPSRTSNSLESASLNELVLALTEKSRTLSWVHLKALRDDPSYDEQKTNIFTLLEEIKGLVAEIEGV